MGLVSVGKIMYPLSYANDQHSASLTQIPGIFTATLGQMAASMITTDTENLQPRGEQSLVSVVRAFVAVPGEYRTHAELEHHVDVNHERLDIITHS